MSVKTYLSLSAAVKTIHCQKVAVEEMSATFNRSLPQCFFVDGRKPCWIVKPSLGVLPENFTVNLQYNDFPRRLVLYSPKRSLHRF